MVYGKNINNRQIIALKKKIHGNTLFQFMLWLLKQRNKSYGFRVDAVVHHLC